LKDVIERDLSDFKVINSQMKVVTSILKDTQVKVGFWCKNLDLRVIEMDDHAMVLGKDSLLVAQAIPMVDYDILLIIAGGRTMIVLMVGKTRLGYRLRIDSMTLYEKDPNVKHQHVEQHGLGWVTQVTKDNMMIEFVARTMKENKDGGGRMTPPITKKHVVVSSIESIHHGIIEERGGPSAFSKARK